MKSQLLFGESGDGKGEGLFVLGVAEDVKVKFFQPEGLESRLAACCGILDVKLFGGGKYL